MGDEKIKAYKVILTDYMYTGDSYLDETEHDVDIFLKRERALQCLVDIAQNTNDIHFIKKSSMGGSAHVRFSEIIWNDPKDVLLIRWHSKYDFKDKMSCLDESKNRYHIEEITLIK